MAAKARINKFSTTFHNIIVKYLTKSNEVSRWWVTCTANDKFNKSYVTNKIRAHVQ